MYCRWKRDSLSHCVQGPIVISKVSSDDFPENMQSSWSVVHTSMNQTFFQSNLTWKQLKNVFVRGYCQWGMPIELSAAGDISNWPGCCAKTVGNDRLESLRCLMGLHCLLVNGKDWLKKASGTSSFKRFGCSSLCIFCAHLSACISSSMFKTGQWKLQEFKLNTDSRLPDSLCLTAVLLAVFI